LHLVDVLGGDALRRSIEAIAVEGRITCVGFLRGAEASIDLLPILMKRAILQGNSVASRQSFEEMNAMMDQRGLKPAVIEHV
jgi:D-arabinose 1-dehydrogenase-like Zn-dependent alcohol dehydrogenase